MASGRTRHREEWYYKNGRRIGWSERVLGADGAELIFGEDGEVRYRLRDASDFLTTASLEVLKDGQVVSVYEAQSGWITITARGLSAALPSDLELVSGTPAPEVERLLDLQSSNRPPPQ